MAMILTLGFDDDSFARLEPLRQRHFPSDRNFIPVHVSLFQQLPDAEEQRLFADLGAVARRTAPLAFRAPGLLDFGGGCAVDLDCPPAKSLQQDLLRRWQDIVTQSDDRVRKLHVTLQNKVDKGTARATLEELRAGFTPWEGRFDALLLWHYRGGPWERAGTFPFRSGDTP